MRTVPPPHISRPHPHSPPFSCIYLVWSRTAASRRGPELPLPGNLAPNAYPPPFSVWSEILAADNGLALTSFAVGGATMNLLPGAPTVDAGYELTVYDSVKPVITQPAAAVIQLGSNGEGRAGAC